MSSRKKGKPKLCHANLLKRYYRRAHVNQATVLDEPSSSRDADDVLEVSFSPSEEDHLEMVECYLHRL